VDLPSSTGNPRALLQLCLLSLSLQPWRLQPMRIENLLFLHPIHPATRPIPRPFLKEREAEAMEVDDGSLLFEGTPPSLLPPFRGPPRSRQPCPHLHQRLSDHPSQSLQHSNQSLPSLFFQTGMWIRRSSMHNFKSVKDTTS